MGKKFWNPRVKRILSVALVLAVLVTIGAAIAGGATLGENIVQTLLAPVRGAVAAFDRGAERLYGYLFRYDAAIAEAEALRQQLAAQETAVREAETYRRENERLRELLQLAGEHPDYTLEAAYVTAWNSASHTDTLTVDKGENAGLAQGMCAITSAGHVVGLVSAVGPNWARVTTVFDTTSQISAAVASTGETGVVQGSRAASGEKLLQMRYLASAAVLRNGDQIVTTGSALYPRGLLLGTIVGAEPDASGIDKLATIDTGFRVEVLEQIFFIKGYTKD